MNNNERHITLKDSEINDEKLIDYIKTELNSNFDDFSYLIERLGYEKSDTQITSQDGTEVTVRKFLADLQKAVEEKDLFNISLEICMHFDRFIDFENTNINVYMGMEINKAEQEFLEKLDNCKKIVYVYETPFEVPDIEWMKEEKNIEISNIENNNTTIDGLIEKNNIFKKYVEENDIKNKDEWKYLFDYLVKNSFKITTPREAEKIIKTQRWIENRGINFPKAEILIKATDIKNFTEDDLKKIFEIGEKDEICLKADTIAEINDDIIKKLNISHVEIGKDENSISRKLSIEKYNKIRNVLEQVIEGIGIESSDTEKFKIVYTRLANMITFDKEATEKDTEYANENIDKCRNLENGLLQGKCVCSGYAAILKQALSLVGIESHIMLGKSHAWNVVKINGEWYNTDLTWDYEDIRNNLPPMFCLKNDEDFIKKCKTEMGKQDHTPRGKTLYKCEKPSLEIYKELNKNVIINKVKMFMETMKSAAFEFLDESKAIIEMLNRSFKKENLMLPPSSVEKEINVRKTDLRKSLIEGAPNQQQQAEYAKKRNERKVEEPKKQIEEQKYDSKEMVE